MADATAKFPTALVALAADLGGEIVGLPEAEWTLNTQILAGTAAPFSVIVNEAVSARVPTVGWLTLDNEILHYNALNAGTKTFTCDARAQQDTVAGQHDVGTWVGFTISKRWYNQVMAELIAIQKVLFRPAAVNATGAMTIDWATAGGQSQEWNTTGNVTGITLSNGVAGQNYQLTIKYGGAHTIAWTTTIKWANGVTPTFTSVNGKYDVISLIYNGTDWIGEFSGNH